MQSSLREITERIASGDSEAFSVWYEEWFAQAYATARHAARGDEHEAADITQETLVRFVRKTPILDTPAQVGAWLKRTSLRIALDRAREGERRREREIRRGSLGPRSDGSADDRWKAHVEWLRFELENLDPGSEALLAARFALGRTLAQVGRTFGLSTSAADGRIGRIIKALRRRADEVNDE